MYKNEKYKVISSVMLFVSALFSVILFRAVAYWGMPGYKIANALELFAFAMLGITLLVHNKGMMVKGLYVLSFAYIIKTVYSIIFRFGGVWLYQNYWNGHYLVLYLYIVSCVFATITSIIVVKKINDKREISTKQVIALCITTIAFGAISSLYAIKVGAHTHHFLNFNFLGWIGIVLLLLTIYGYEEISVESTKMESPLPRIKGAQSIKLELEGNNGKEADDLRKIELLSKYHDLLSKGAITQEEYDQKKKELMDM